MSPVIKIAYRNIRSAPKRSVLIMLSVFFSVAVMSLFIFFGAGINATRNPEYRDLPFTEFINKLGYYMTVTVALLLLLTLVTVRIQCTLKSGERERTVGVLTSIGASAVQRSLLVFTDVLILYMPPVILGTAVGVIPGIRLAEKFQGASSGSGDVLIYLLTAIATAIAILLFILLTSLVPVPKGRRVSVMERIKGGKKDSAEIRHGYRQSYTYRSQSAIKRLARKSRDGYSREYSRISLSFASSALYPVIAAFLFICMGRMEVTFDTNPYDGIDTAEAVTAALNNIFLFLGAAFIALAVMGAVQAVLTARIQRAVRMRSERLYLSVGMSRRDFSEMIDRELCGAFLGAAVILIFSAVTVSMLYSL